MISSSDNYASQAWAAGNRAQRLQDKVEALEDALEEAEMETAYWHRCYIASVTTGVSA